MPDQWGRVGFNDFMGMTQALNGIQQVNQRNTKYRQGQADRAQYRAGLTSFAKTGKLPEGTRPDIGVQIKQVYAQGLKADQSIANTKLAGSTQEKLNGLLSWRQENQNKSWDDAPLDLYTGADGMAAYASAIDQEAQTEQGRTTIMKNRLARTDVAFKQFQAARQSIKTFMSAGDTQNVINTLGQLTDDLPIPFQITSYDDTNQVLDVKYLDSHTGKHQKSGKMSLPEALHRVHETGEKEFITGITQSMEAVRRGNVEYRKNPMRGKGYDGREYLIIPQKKPQEPFRVDIEVRDTQTNEKIMFDSWEALNNAGIYKEDLGRDKAVADIDKSKALTGKAQSAQKKAEEDQWVQVDKTGEPIMGQDGRPVYKAATEKQVTAFRGSHPDVSFRRASELESANKFKKGTADAGSAQTDRYQKDLTLVLKPFTKPGTDLGAIFANGDMSEPAKNALETAINFYEKNSGKKESLGRMDRMKLENAEKAIRLYNGMSQTISNQYSQQTAMTGAGESAQQVQPQTPPQPGQSQPPVEGARKAKDGNWYIEDPNRPGKYLKAN